MKNYDIIKWSQRITVLAYNSYEKESKECWPQNRKTIKQNMEKPVCLYVYKCLYSLQAHKY